MKIVQDEQERDRRKRQNRLVEISREVLNECSIAEEFNYFSIKPRDSIFTTNSNIFVFPEKKLIYVYDRRNLQNSVKLADSYETSGVKDFQIRVCY